MTAEFNLHHTSTSQRWSKQKLSADASLLIKRDGSEHSNGTKTYLNLSQGVQTTTNSIQLFKYLPHLHTKTSDRNELTNILSMPDILY